MNEWRRLAACRQQDPELFFPTATYAPQQVAQAKTVCAACHTFDLARRASERAKRYARRERLEEVAS